MASEAKILIADDEVSVRVVLLKHIKEWGYDTLIAYDGEEALRILESDDPPVVAILDWMMPYMSGLEVCQHLSSYWEDRPYLIMLTSRSQASDLLKAFRAGVDDFLTKPIDIEKLRERILVGIQQAKVKKELHLRANQLAAEPSQSNPPEATET